MKFIISIATIFVQKKDTIVNHFSLKILKKLQTFLKDIVMYCLEKFYAIKLYLIIFTIEKSMNCYYFFQNMFSIMMFTIKIDNNLRDSYIFEADYSTPALLMHDRRKDGYFKKIIFKEKINSLEVHKVYSEGPNGTLERVTYVYQNNGIKLSIMKNSGKAGDYEYTLKEEFIPYKNKSIDKQNKKNLKKAQ